ncbi:hypothetical protein niasHT_028950 [Heterodera trifolii]|uniref:DNA/RNA-binding protein Alba-like domain-containing protein n=1 Tax=Heterodera trifolii TaxID=157864 RepID=A0ABD2KNH4_9BILA
MDDPKTYNFSFPELVTKNALHFAFRKHTKIERILKRIDVELQKDGTESGVRQLLFHGIGDGCERCVSCVEVLKSRLASQGKNVFQWNELSSSTTTTTTSSKCDGMEALNISENSPKNDTAKPSKKDENHPQPVLAILISLDPFPTTDGDNLQHSLSQQRSDQQQNLPPFFSAQLDENNDQPKQKRTKKIGVGMAKRTKTGAGNNKWKRPGKGATAK